MVENSNDGGAVTFGVPKGEIKDAYFDLILKQMYHLGLQISQPSPYSSPAIPVMINYIISHIPSQSRRDELRQHIKEDLDSKLTGDEGTEEKNKIIIDTYVENMGNVADYLEKFMGIEKENRLGVIGGKLKDD